MFLTRENQNLKRYVDAFTHLVYPLVCAACHGVLDEDEELICNACLSDLPKTHYWNINNNGVDRLFWGRVDVQMAASFLYFTKGGMVQELLHELKYRGREKIGTFLGTQFAEELKNTQFAKADMIVPVPLHPKKFRSRGYNQCAAASQVLASELGLYYRPDVLIRKSYSGSQTKLSRYSRWKNVNDVFEVNVPNELIGKHIILLDDVVTTGSTLEACAQSILSVSNTKVSILTLAIPMPV